MAYYRFKDEDGNEFGSYEVFHWGGLATRPEALPAGWYWWACFPGCIPDGEPVGPFETEDDARRNAQGEVA